MFSLLKSRSDLLNRRAVFISNAELVVYHWYRNKLDNTYLFETNEAGQQHFARYLRQTPNTPLYMLVDMEETFRLDTIPHVFGADRKALIERRQSRLFRNAVYAHAEIQAREKQGRKDDLVLFSALSNTDVIKPWITILEQHKVPLASITSVPFLLASFLKYIPNPSNHILVVNMQSISGLRQTFFHKKKLKISRLTRLPRYNAQTYATRILEEADKIRRYLYSLRLIPTEQPLEVYCLANSDILSAIGQHNKETATRYHLLNINKIANEIGMRTASTVPFSDQLLIYHLLKDTPTNIYASPHELRYNKLRRFRYALNTASLTILLFSTIYGGTTIWDSVALSKQSRMAKQQTIIYQDRYNSERERLPTTPVEPHQLKAAMTTLEQIESHRTTPVAMMQLLGNILLAFPKVQLKQLEWWGSGEVDAGDIVDNETTSAQQDEDGRYQVINITARIEPFSGDYREAINTVNRFVSALRERNTVHKVTILSLPLNIDPQTQLQGNLQQKGEQADFIIRTVINIKDAAIS